MRADPLYIDKTTVHTAAVHAAVGGFQTLVFDFFNTRPLLVKRFSLLYRNTTAHAGTPGNIELQLCESPIASVVKALNDGVLSALDAVTLTAVYSEMQFCLTVQPVLYDTVAFRGGVIWEPPQPVYIKPNGYGFVAWAVWAQTDDKFIGRLEYEEVTT